MHFFRENYNMDNWPKIGQEFKEIYIQYPIIIRFFENPCFFNILIIGTQ
jgi:hypothetical protein